MRLSCSGWMGSRRRCLSRPAPERMPRVAVVRGIRYFPRAARKRTGTPEARRPERVYVNAGMAARNCRGNLPAVSRSGKSRDLPQSPRSWRKQVDPGKRIRYWEQLNTMGRSLLAHTNAARAGRAPVRRAASNRPGSEVPIVSARFLLPKSNLERKWGIQT